MEDRACLCARMADKKTANALCHKRNGVKTGFREQGVNARPSRKACQRAGNGALWMLKKLMELRSAADEDRFFEKGYPADLFTMFPHQRLQARLSTGARGFGLASVRQRVSSFSVSLCKVLPAVLVDMSGPIGERIQEAAADAAREWAWGVPPRPRAIAKIDLSIPGHRVPVWTVQCANEGKGADKLLPE